MRERLADRLRAAGWAVVRFCTLAAWDPEPTYSALDRMDGLGGGHRG